MKNRLKTWALLILLLIIWIGIYLLSYNSDMLITCCSSPDKIPAVINPKDFGNECVRWTTCNWIVEIDCGAAVDGPLYFVAEESGEIIEYCGGYCDTPTPGTWKCVHCPPRTRDCNEWLYPYDWTVDWDLVEWDTSTKRSHENDIIVNSGSSTLLDTTRIALPSQTDESLRYLSLPDWFIATEFANVPWARSLEVVENDQWITVFVWNRTWWNVYAVQDTNYDLRADNVIQLVEWRNQPNGVAFQDGNLYVAEIDTIHRFSDILNNLESPSSEVIFDELPSDKNHWWKYIEFGPDGELYIPIWAPCNICDAALPYSSLNRLNLETNEFVNVAEGLRNTVWFGRHPESGELRLTDNGRDRFGDDLPPDELNRLTKEWEHFGYPFCHGWEYPDDQFTSRPCEDFTKPFAQLGPHVAALWLDFWVKSNFPDKYTNAIFIAERWSRNRTVATWYRVSMVNLETWNYTSFIEWRYQDNRIVWRPVDVKFLRNGAMLVSDDYAGKIYAIRYVWSK